MKKTIIKDKFLLNQKATVATKEDISVAIDLKDTLIANQTKALGLAANMIGVNKQIIALFIGPLPIVMINPKIIKKKKKYSTKEGCLSLKGERSTERFENIIVQYRDINFQERQGEYEGIVAETIQHEVDHLSGKII